MSNNVSAEEPRRLVSLDAHRGFVMCALISGFFGFMLLPEVLGDSALGRFIGYEMSHVPWAGCAVWDLIQPSFMFIVGVAMPFSIAARKKHGDTPRRLWGHAIYRAVVLVLLGLFLRSQGRGQTYFTFEDVVSQIGLGYLFVFALAGRGVKVQAIFAAVVLLGYWLLFALWPLPSAPVDAQAMGLPDDWAMFSGFAAHWNKGLNPAGYFDRWFLNLFPRETPWGFHGGGYVTLSFIPSMATMTFGLMTGEWMQSARAIEDKFRMLVKAGLACLLFGFVVDGNIWPLVEWHWSAAPIVKRIWTPSWAVFSAGWALLSLALFVYLVDIKGWQRWTFPLRVVGMNSIAAYVMHGPTQGWVNRNLETHLRLEHFMGNGGEAIIRILGILAIWYILYWMYKRKVFIRI